MSKTYRQRINYDRLYDMCSKELSENGVGIARVVCPDKRDSASFRSSFERHLSQNDCRGISVFIWKEELMAVSDVHIHTFDEDKTKTHKQLTDECFEYATKNGACRITFRNRYASTFKTRAFDLDRGSVVFCKRRETVYVFDEKSIPTIDAVYVEREVSAFKDNEFTNEKIKSEELLFPYLQYKLLETNPIVVVQFEEFDPYTTKTIIRTIPCKYYLHIIPIWNRCVLLNVDLFEYAIINSYKEFTAALSKVKESRKPTVFILEHLVEDGELSEEERLCWATDIFACPGLEACFVSEGIAVVDIATAKAFYIPHNQ